MAAAVAFDSMGQWSMGRENGKLEQTNIENRYKVFFSSFMPNDKTLVFGFHIEITAFCSALECTHLLLSIECVVYRLCGGWNQTIRTQINFRTIVCENMIHKTTTNNHDPLPPTICVHARKSWNKKEETQKKHYH